MSPTPLLEIDPEELRLLERMGEAGGDVLSVFLSLEQPEVPTGRVREAELEAGLTEAETRLRGETGEAAAAALGSCLERVRAELGSAVVDDPGVRGAAFFCAEGGELRAYALRRPPAYHVAAAFRAGAALEPLVEAMPGQSWGVAVVDRKHGRVFRGTDVGLVEVAGVDDDVHRWHSQGGWSQGRYQRGIEKEARDHVRHVCDLLFALHERRPFAWIALVCPGETLPVVEKSLHPYLRERLAGKVAADLENASAAQVLERVGGLMTAVRESREREAIERLERGLGTGNRAVAGTDEVLAAIDGRQVGTLLVAEGSRDDAIERAVEGAIGQAADVLVLPAEAMDRYGRVAALLRY